MPSFVLALRDALGKDGNVEEEKEVEDSEFAERMPIGEIKLVPGRSKEELRRRDKRKDLLCRIGLKLFISKPNSMS
jgi:hypothetical protein